MKKIRAAMTVALSCPLLASGVMAATIRVPQDHVAIQDAIDAAVDGDEVVLSPGTYRAVIDFKGKAITVTSRDGPKKTIIDGGGWRSVVRFHTGETRASVLSGLTLQNGAALDHPGSGGGVQIVNASPTIRGNIVRANSACDGNGISAHSSSALIVGNQIYNNRQTDCHGGTVGGGIHIGGEGAVEVIDNVIENNQTDLAGGGIGMNGAGRPVISRNTIRFNTAGNDGGGVATMNSSNPTFINNAVYGNTAGVGGGIALSVPQGAQGGLFINNTVADNQASRGSELHIVGFASRVQLTNNIFFTSKGTSSVACSGDYDPVSPIFRNNDVHASNGAPVDGVCAIAAGQNGNIAVDPLFNSAGKGAKAYALTTGSPALDAGAKTSVPGGLDLLGHRRKVDGNGDGLKLLDLGAIEYSAR